MNVVCLSEKPEINSTIQQTIFPLNSWLLKISVKSFRPYIEIIRHDNFPRDCGIHWKSFLGGENVLVIVVNPFRKFGEGEEWMERIERGAVKNSRSSSVFFLISVAFLEINSNTFITRSTVQNFLYTKSKPYQINSKISAQKALLIRLTVVSVFVNASKGNCFFLVF